MYALCFYDLYHSDSFIGSDRFSNIYEANASAAQYKSSMVIVKVIAI